MKTEEYTYNESTKKIENEEKCFTIEKEDGSVQDTPFSISSYTQYLQEISHFPQLSVERQLQLGHEIRNGSSQARTELINCNLKLVVSIAKKYFSRAKHLNELDIIEEGNAGLIQAVEEYDPEKGAFTTYASYWIQQYIRRAIINQDSTIRKPIHFHILKSKYHKIEAECMNNNLPLPSDEELCQILKTTPETLYFIKNPSNIETVSLFKLVGEDEESELIEFIPSEENAYEDLLNKMVERDLLICLKEILSPLKYYIIWHHILNSPSATLEDMATSFHVTKERIRQVEEKTLKFLKPYMTQNSKKLNNTLNTIHQKEKEKYSRLKVKPITPSQITTYLYLKNILTNQEEELYILKNFSKYTYNKEQYANQMGISIEKLDTIIQSLQAKMKMALADTSAFQKFCDNISKEYKTKIYTIVDNIANRQLIEKYSHKTYGELRNELARRDYTLNRAEQCLLKKYSLPRFQSKINQSQITTEINSVMFNYKHYLNQVPKEKLIHKFNRYRNIFTEEEQLYLECYFFNTTEPYIFNESYPNSTVSTRFPSLISKLESYYYNLNLYQDSITYNDYLELRYKFADALTKLEKRILDLYFGVYKKAYSISSISNTTSLTNYEVENIIEQALAKLKELSKLKNNSFLINKKIYTSYINNIIFNFDPQVQNILKMYYFNELPISTISENMQMSISKVTNVISQALETIDIYRYREIKSFKVTEQDIEQVYKRYGQELTNEFKEIVRLFFIKHNTAKEIALTLDININSVEENIKLFEQLYIDIKSPQVDTITIEDIAFEVLKEDKDSVLTPLEKKFISLIYGLNNKYNNLGITISYDKVKHEISSLDDPASMHDNIINKIKATKSGFLKPGTIYLSKERLDNLLVDPHLPVPTKLLNTFCNIEYQKATSRITKEENNLDYQKATIIICKYLNHEIEGRLNYQEDVKPLNSAFSNRDQAILEDYYQNEMSREVITKKYNVSYDELNNIINYLKRLNTVFKNNSKEFYFDFDYYYDAINNPSLPYYGNLKLATSIFNLAYGLTDNKHHNYQEINTILKTNYSEDEIKTIINELMLSICKLKNGFTKENTFTYEEICTYYKAHQTQMSYTQIQLYQSYFDKIKRSLKDPMVDTLVPPAIINDLITALYPDAFNLSIATKDDIIKIIEQYNSLIDISTIEQLTYLYDIKGQDIMTELEKESLSLILLHFEKNS